MTAKTEHGRFDVVVIGGGITGLSTALHLERRRIKRIALSSSKSPAAATRSASGLATASYLDNFTRFSHAFGLDRALGAWTYSRDAFAASERFLGVAAQGGANATLLHGRGRHLRLIVSKDEWDEAIVAVDELRRQGLAAELQKRAAWSAANGVGLGERVLGVQIDDAGTKATAMIVDVGRWTAAMEAEITAAALPPVTSIEPGRDGLTLIHEGGGTSQTEIAVCATHLGTGVLVPELNEALVPYADQWSRFSVPRFRGDDKLSGCVFSARHGHEWGGFERPGEVIVGGARYLRKWAGIDAKTALLDERVTAHLAAIFGETFTVSDAPKLLDERAFRECRPCDELPVVGPMFGEGRILIATGFLGTGLTLGYFAGECLAELIATGASPKLPRFFWPERLRSLEG